MDPAPKIQDYLWSNKSNQSHIRTHTCAHTHTDSHAWACVLLGVCNIYILQWNTGTRTGMCWAGLSSTKGVVWAHIWGNAKLNAYCGNSSSCTPQKPVTKSQKGFPYNTSLYKPCDPITRITIGSRDTFSHLHSHVVPRNFFRITVRLSRKGYSPIIKNRYLIQIKTYTKQNQHTHRRARSKNGNSPLINTYHDTNGKHTQIHNLEYWRRVCLVLSLKFIYPGIE